MSPFLDSYRCQGIFAAGMGTLDSGAADYNSEDIWQKAGQTGPSNVVTKKILYTLETLQGLQNCLSSHGSRTKGERRIQDRDSYKASDEDRNRDRVIDRVTNMDRRN
jgi:hypothetical protein